MHFALTDDGELALDGLGEEMEADTFDFCYPELAKARLTGTHVEQAVARAPPPTSPTSTKASAFSNSQEAPKDSSISRNREKSADS